MRRRRRRNRRHPFLKGLLVLWAGAVTIALFMQQQPDRDGLDAERPASDAQAQAGNKPQELALPRADPDSPPGQSAVASGAHDNDASAPAAIAQADQRRTERPALTSPEPDPSVAVEPDEEIAEREASPISSPEGPRLTEAPTTDPGPADSTAQGFDSESSSEAASDVAQLETAPESPSTPSPNVARAQFTTDIENREPVDRVESIFPADAQGLRTLFYFTEILDMDGQTVTHRWEHEGAVMAEVSFQIGGPRWRVYSSKTLTPAMTGQWRVSVVDASGQIIRTDSFMYEGS